AGEFLFAFGGPGPEVGQFQRPQALAFSTDLSELYIADACNHRIVVTDPRGTPLRVLGEPGRGAGQLAYPYDVMVLDDGSLLVCEFGNNRLQRLSAEGQCLGLYGCVGTGEGELRYPWGVDGTDERIFVLDSGNNRVQVLGGI
ncbi:MAG: NHL repeat-containing protein, partial [Planctomycetota bacterium]